MRLLRTNARSAFALLLVIGLGTGCGDSTSAEDGSTGGKGGTGGVGAGGTGGTDSGDCDAGDSMCVDGALSTCVEEGGVLVWSEPAACPANTFCSMDSCQEPTAQQKAQAAVIETYTNDLRNYTGYAGEMDFDALKEQAVQNLFQGDGSDHAFAKAVYSVFKSVPQGHAAIGFGPLSWDDCFDPDGVAVLNRGSWYGVCARSAGETSIVTFADPANPLGLSPGDKVVGITKGGETWSGADLLARVGEEPICDGSRPSESSRADHEATHVFGVINEGDTLEILHPDGSTTTVTVPERGELIGCTDPFRREERLEFFSTSQRADGVVVIILPTLGDHPDHPFPNPLTTDAYRQWNADAIAMINTDLSQYNGVTGLVWDIRGNSGGSPEYGMGLIGSLGNSEGGLGNCYARIPASSPPAFTEQAEYPFPYQVFVDQPLPTIQYAGPQAIVADGMTISAADWMLYRAHQEGIPIIGHAGHGAYGYQTGPSFVEMSIAPNPKTHIGVSSFISGAYCVDSDGQALEGTAPIDTVVDFDAADLAAGIDTQLEAAVSQVLTMN